MVALPKEATFVIANSFTPVNKSTDPHKRFNLRVVECMLAAKVLGYNLQLPQWKTLTTLHQLQDMYRQQIHRHVSLQEMVVLSHKYLVDGCTKALLEELLNTTDLSRLFLNCCDQQQ